MVHNPVDSVLACLRRAARVCHINAKTSGEFQHASCALIALRAAVDSGQHSLADDIKCEVARRSQALVQGVHLQRHLEQDLGVPHFCSLGQAVDIAVDSALISKAEGMRMRSVVQKANAGRHRKWSSSVLSEHDDRISRHLKCARDHGQIISQKLCALSQLISAEIDIPVTSDVDQMLSKLAMLLGDAQKSISNINPFMQLDTDTYDHAFEHGLKEKLDKAFAAGSSLEEIDLVQSCGVCSDSVNDKLVKESGSSSRQQAVILLQSWVRGSLARRQVLQVKQYLGGYRYKLSLDYGGRITVDFEDFSAFEDWSME